MRKLSLVLLILGALPSMAAATDDANVQSATRLADNACSAIAGNAVVDGTPSQQSPVANVGGGACSDPSSPYYPCVPIYEPPSDDTGGSACPTPRDQASCDANCQCQYAKNVDKCRKERQGAVCVETAKAERKACQGNCMADFPAR